MREPIHNLEDFSLQAMQQIEGLKVLNDEKTASIDIRKNIRYIPDFVCELNGNKYMVEVKRSFSISIMNKLLDKINEAAKSINAVAILIFFERIPQKYRSLIEDNYKIQVFDIANILYTVIKNKELVKELSALVSFSLDTVVPEKPKLDIKIKKNVKKNKTPNYIKELHNLESGIKNAKKYENLLERIIKDIFISELELFYAQNRTEDGINIFDMICKIKNTEDEFFTTLERFFNSKYILFEFKNYSEKIKQGEICTTEKYLYGTALRNVAIIITRKGIDTNGDKLVKGILRETGKLMLVLNDDDVIKMIELYDNGDKASDVLMKKLDKMLVTLEK